MADKKLTFEVTGRGLEKLIKDSTNLSKVWKSMFGDGKPGTGGKSDIDKQVKGARDLARALGTDATRGADALLRKMKDVSREMDSLKSKYPNANFLAPGQAPGAPPPGGPPEPPEANIPGAGGDRWAALKTAGAGAALGTSFVTGWKLGSSFFDNEDKLRYGPGLTVGAAQNQQMGFAQARGNILELLADQTDNALNQEMRSNRWNNSVRGSLGSAVGSFLNPFSWGETGKILSETERKAGIDSEAAAQEIKRLQVQGLSPGTTAKWGWLADTADRNTRANFLLGKGRAVSISQLDTGKIKEGERLDIATSLASAGGRSIANNEVIKAIAAGVEQGMDKSLSVAAVALGAATGGSFLSSAADPSVRAALTQARMGSAAVGTWARGGGIGEGYGSAIAFGLTGNSAMDMRTVQENSRGMGNLGGVYAGTNNNYQRAMNLSIASSFGGGDPWATSLLSNFGNNPRELADLFGKNGTVPEYLQGIVDKDQLKSYARSVGRASISNMPVSESFLNAHAGGKLWKAYQEKGNWAEALAAVGANTPKQMRAEIAKVSGILSAVDPSLEGNPELARERISAMAGVDFIGAPSGGKGSKGSPAGADVLTDFQEKFSKDASTFERAVNTFALTVGEKSALEKVAADREAKLNAAWHAPLLTPQQAAAPAQAAAKAREEVLRDRAMENALKQP